MTKKRLSGQLSGQLFGHLSGQLLGYYPAGEAEEHVQLDAEDDAQSIQGLSAWGSQGALGRYDSQSTGLCQPLGRRTCGPCGRAPCPMQHSSSCGPSGPSGPSGRACQGPGGPSGRACSLSGPSGRACSPGGPSGRACTGQRSESPLASQSASTSASASTTCGPSSRACQGSGSCWQGPVPRMNLTWKQPCQSN